MERKTTPKIYWVHLKLYKQMQKQVDEHLLKSECFFLSFSSKTNSFSSYLDALLSELISFWFWTFIFSWFQLVSNESTFEVGVVLTLESNQHKLLGCVELTSKTVIFTTQRYRTDDDHHVFYNTAKYNLQQFFYFTIPITFALIPKCMSNGKF